MEAITIVESVAQPGIASRIDREAGVIRDVLVLSRKSANRRTYSDKALDSAKRLFEAADVNLDHPKGAPTQPRGIVEGWGQLKGLRRKGDQVRGDLHYLKEHDATPLLLERIERNFNGGLSINALGQMTRNGAEDAVVEDITKANSVDFVSRPATTTSLFEHTIEDGDQPGAVTLAEVTEAIATELPAATCVLERVVNSESLSSRVSAAIAGASPAAALGVALSASLVAIVEEAGDDPAVVLETLQKMLCRCNHDEPPKPEGDEPPAPEDGEKPAGEAKPKLEEQVATLTQQVGQLLQEQTVTRVLAEFGLTERALPALRLRQLYEAKGADAVRTIVAALPQAGRKTPIGGVLESRQNEGATSPGKQSPGTIPLTSFLKATEKP